MTSDIVASNEPPRASAAANAWQKPALWVIVALAALMLLASFTGDGTGMFGWGFMMGMMWIWMLVPILIIVLLVALIMQVQEQSR